MLCCKRVIIISSNPRSSSSGSSNGSSSSIYEYCFVRKFVISLSDGDSDFRMADAVKCVVIVNLLFQEENFEANPETAGTG